MNLKASLMFTKSLLFPKAEKKSSARKSMFGALLCIGLSIVPLVVVLTVSNGMISGMTERLIALSSSHLEALVARNSLVVKNAERFELFAKEIECIDGVINAYPEICITALAGGKKERSGARIRAVSPDLFIRNKDFTSLFSVTDGSFDSFKAGEKTAIIGQKLSESLDLKAGDTFRIITTKTSGGITVPKLTSFKVGAVVSSGYQELDALWVFVPLDVAYSSLSLSAADYSVMIETADAFSPLLEKVRDDVQEFSEGYANVYTWNEMNAAEFENFSSTRVMLVFIMILIVLVASVNISSAIIMLVMERRKEIAILKSTGASSKGIALSFLLAGLSCGTGGVLIGLPIGLLLSVNINEIISGIEKFINLFYEIKLMDPAYYLTESPVTIPFCEVFGIVCATLILSLLVSVLPSLKAGKEKPCELMQKA